MNNPYFLTSLDVGGSADPAALVVLHVSKPERVTKARVLHLSIKNPVVTPVMHIDFVQQAMTKIVEKFGPRIPVRYVVDVSNNSAIAYMLANALPHRASSASGSPAAKAMLPAWCRCWSAMSVAALPAFR